MRSTPFLVLAAVAVFAVAACSPGAGGVATPSAAPSTAPSVAAPEAPSAGAPDAAGLDGRTFQGISVTGTQLADVTKIRLGFQGSNLSASGGCNQMGGTYVIKDGVLSTGQMMTTEMACAEPLMQQDTWLSTFLNGAALTLDGATLTLTKDGTTMTMTDRTVSDPDRPVEGTNWVLDGLIANQGVSSVPAGVEARMTIANGNVRLEAGCNSGGGSVDVTDTTLVIGPIAATKMACEGPAMAVENQVLAVLDSEVTYAIDAGQLTIMNGDQGLTFRAAS